MIPYYIFASFVERKSTLFVIFEISAGDEMTMRYLTEKMALIPDDTKLLITTRYWERMKEITESLHVMYNTSKERYVATMLEILSKRWMTLDLISIMHEVQRTFCVRGYYYPVVIKDSLSSLPRLQKTEEDP